MIRQTYLKKISWEQDRKIVTQDVDIGKENYDNWIWNYLNTVYLIIHEIYSIH